MITVTARSRLKSRLPRDAVVLLTIFAVLCLALPARYVIGPLGAAGAPAQLFGLLLGLWWAAEWLAQPWRRSTFAQPLKRCALLFVAAVLASYLVAAIRPISPDEQLPGDRALLNIVAWVGLMTAAMDGIATRAGLDTLLRRVSVLGGIEAGMGILQLLTGQALVKYLQLPGLTDKGIDGELISRGGFFRPSGTATHPIEFGVVLAMLLPIALHFAVVDAGRRSVLARWLPAGALAVALSLSVSRSAIVCTAVALPVLLTTWPRHLRRWVFLAVPSLIAILVVVIPGFVGTVVSLFTGISNDSSAASRTGSYGLAWSFIVRAPVFGRGMGTFLPRYRILDNQYLGSLIELGFVGVASMLLLFVVGILTAWRLRRLPAAAEGGRGDSSMLASALAAAMLGGAVSFAFFDAWGFPMIPSMLFLMFGCAGALRRLSLEGDRSSLHDVPESMTNAPVAPAVTVDGEQVR